MQTAQSVDENAILLVLDGFAVWIAGMIDPSRLVSTDRGIDYVFAVVEAEIICAMIIGLGRNTLPWNAATGVFDDARAFANGSRRENAATVHVRFTNLQER